MFYFSVNFSFSRYFMRKNYLVIVDFYLNLWLFYNCIVILNKKNIFCYIAQTSVLTDNPSDKVATISNNQYNKNTLQYGLKFMKNIC